MAKWISVDFTLGSLPHTGSNAAVYPIPDEIPATADEILVYVHIHTGPIPGVEAHFDIFVEQQLNGLPAGFKFYVHASNLQAVPYNSDCVWLPVPPDRDVKAKRTGGDISGGSSAVQIIAWR